MSAGEHDVQKGDDASNYSAFNLNKQFLQNLRDAGGSCEQQGAFKAADHSVTQ